MNIRRINHVNYVMLCVIISISLVSCGSNDYDSSLENDLSQTTVASITTTLATTATTEEVTTEATTEATTETTVTMIRVSDIGISLSEYEEQQEQLRKEELYAANKIGEVIINTKSDPLNMREFPDKDSKSLLKIPKGTVVPYYDYDGEWFLVQYDGERGYVRSDYVQIKGNTDSGYNTEYGLVKINTKSDPLNMRESPSKDSKKLDEIPKGTVVPYCDINGDWIEVEYNGQWGWISRNYVVFEW